MYMSVCKPAENEGVAVIHGSRGFFHSEKQPAFQAIYRAFEEVFIFAVSCFQQIIFCFFSFRLAKIFIKIFICLSLFI